MTKYNIFHAQSLSFLSLWWEIKLLGSGTSTIDSAYLIEW